jgi:hypothetical protein
MRVAGTRNSRVEQFKQLYSNRIVSLLVHLTRASSNKGEQTCPRWTMSLATKNVGRKRLRKESPASASLTNPSVRRCQTPSRHCLVAFRWLPSHLRAVSADAERSVALELVSRAICYQVDCSRCCPLHRGFLPWQAPAHPVSIVVGPSTSTSRPGAHRLLEPGDRPRSERR